MFEVEYKLRILDPIAFRKQIQDQGADLLKILDQVDLYYNGTAPLRDFAASNEVLRLRTTTEKDPETLTIAFEISDLTYKGPSLTDTVKSRVEHVSQLLDPERMDLILHALGYENQCTVKKQRELYEVMYEGRRMEISLDQIDGLPGWYAEIEVQVESDIELPAMKILLTAFIQTLGFSEQDALRYSYLEMILCIASPPDSPK